MTTYKRNPILLAAGEGPEHIAEFGVSRFGLPIAGEPVLRHVYRTAVSSQLQLHKAGSVEPDPIYIWGDQRNIKEYLGDELGVKIGDATYIRSDGVLTRILPSQRGVVNNVMYALMRYGIEYDTIISSKEKDRRRKDIEQKGVLGVLDCFNTTLTQRCDWFKDTAFTLVLADQPLLLEQELSALRTRDLQQGYQGVWEWSTREALDDLLQKAGLEGKMDYHEAKMNFFNLKDRDGNVREIRFGGVYTLSGLEAIDSLALSALNISYKHRHLITTDVMTRTANLVNCITEYLALPGKVAQERGTTTKEARANITAGLKTWLAMLKPHMFKAAFLDPLNYSTFTRLESALTFATGMRLEVVATPFVGPLLDIDNKYCYGFLRDNYRKLRAAQEQQLMLREE